MDWYDRKGNPLVTVSDLTDPKWQEQMMEVEKLLRDREYVVVKQEYTPKNSYFISTVWLGLDQNIPAVTKVDKPVIFETMVFHGNRDVDMLRYCTEEEALLGHQEFVAKYSEME